MAAAHQLLTAKFMARIRSLRRGDMVHVVITGQLTAGDMGRLEHACCEALLANPCPLELDLREMTGTDRTAEAVISRMAARGAMIVDGNRRRRSE